MALRSALGEMVEKERRRAQLIEHAGARPLQNQPELGSGLLGPPDELMDLRKLPPDAPIQAAVEISEPFSPGRHATLSFLKDEDEERLCWIQRFFDTELLNAGLLPEACLPGVLITMSESREAVR